MRDLTMGIVTGRSGGLNRKNTGDCEEDHKRPGGMESLAGGYVGTAKRESELCVEFRCF